MLQFFTSLLWATIAEQYGRRVVLVITLVGSGISTAISSRPSTKRKPKC